MYRITIVYVTGDSENTYQEESELGVWEDLAILKENLRRLQEYETWARKKEWYGHQRDVDVTPPEFVVMPQKNAYQPAIKLVADNGNEYQVTPFWDDTFSHLVEARVELALGFRSEDIDIG